ncbi:MAG: hypothetical protein ACPL2D_10605 [Ignavibacteria bacterium]
MYYVSVSVLEKFRRYLDEVSEFDTKEAVLEAITGKFAPNDKVIVGQAYHKMIEALSKYNNYYPDIILFDEKQIEPARKFVSSLKVVGNEISVYKQYGNYKVGGRIDILEADTIRDVKVTFKFPSYDEYFDSYQWRFYLDILEMERFLYDIFVVHDFAGLNSDMFPVPIPDAKIEYDDPPIECLAYNNMQSDIKLLVKEFDKFIKVNQYENLLKTVQL